VTFFLISAALDDERRVLADFGSVKAITSN